MTYFKRNKKHPAKSRNQIFNEKILVKSFLNLYENKLQNDLKICLNFVRMINSSLIKKKLKKLPILLKEFFNDQKEDFFYLQRHLALIEHFETIPFVNK